MKTHELLDIITTLKTQGKILYALESHSTLAGEPVLMLNPETVKELGRVLLSCGEKLKELLPNSVIEMIQRPAQLEKDGS